MSSKPSPPSPCINPPLPSCRKNPGQGCGCLASFPPIYIYQLFLSPTDPSLARAVCQGVWLGQSDAACEIVAPLASSPFLYPCSCSFPSGPTFGSPAPQGRTLRYDSIRFCQTRLQNVQQGLSSLKFPSPSPIAFFVWPSVSLSII